MIDLEARMVECRGTVGFRMDVGKFGSLGGLRAKQERGKGGASDVVA